MENFSPTIDFKRSLCDDQVLDLLKKLDGIPVEMLRKDIEEEHLSAIKVYLNGICHGVMLVRGVIDYNGNFTLVICHTIAETGKNLMEVLSMGFPDCALWRWAEKSGFRFVRQHADTAALSRVLEKFYNKIESVVYIKDLKLCQKVNQTQANNQAPRRQITTNESLMKAE